MRLVDRDQEGELYLTCPTCRQATPVPDTGVSGLKSAFHINHLLEIVEEHKKEKDTAIAETTEEGVATGVAQQQQSSHCTEHVDEELKLYCETCSEVICYKCISTKWGRHHSHDYESIGEAFEKFKEEVSPFLESMVSQLTKIDQVLTDLEMCSAEVTVQQDFVEANIEGAVREIKIALESRKKELLNRLQEISRGKLKSLAAQKEQLETTQAQLHSCEGFVRQSIKTECQSEVLKMRKAIVHQAKELTTEYPAAFLTPCTKADLMFLAPGDVSAVLQQYGNVSTAESLVNPVNCYATSSGLKSAVCGEKSVVIVQAINWNSRQCLEPIKSLECELESILTGARVRGGVEDIGSGQYQVSYRPVSKGKNLLHIRISGMDIRGSPFFVRVVSPVEYCGVPIQTFDAWDPCGVAFNHVDEIILISSYCISVLSQNGTTLRSFGTRGSGLGQFKCLMGVTVDDEGNILVADRDNHRIQKFTNDGRFLASVGTEGTGPLQFNSPMDIAFNVHNKQLYVVDSGNHRIQVLNADLTISKIFREKWNWDVRSVTCDKDGNVYVIGCGEKVVQVFKANGKRLWEFSRQVELGPPAGVAVNSKGKVIVSDYSDHSISIFTTKGQLVSSFGRKGKRPGEFNYPGSLAVDDYGVLCVCDHANSRIQIF